MKSVDGCMSDFTLVCSTQVCLGVFSSAVKGAVGIFMSWSTQESCQSLQLPTLTYAYVFACSFLAYVAWRCRKSPTRPYTWVKGNALTFTVLLQYCVMFGQGHLTKKIACKGVIRACLLAYVRTYVLQLGEGSRIVRALYGSPWDSSQSFEKQPRDLWLQGSKAQYATLYVKVGLLFFCFLMRLLSKIRRTG